MYLLLAAFVIVWIATTTAAGSLWKEWRLVNMPLHAAIEALGGLSAVVIAVFLLQRQGEAHGARRLPLAMGFLGMGILDTFHAITTPGHGFVLLHNAASLAGGSCFALVWLPDRWIRRQTRYKGWLSCGVAIGTISFGAWTLVARQSLPAMTRGDEFTAASVGLNLLAGVLFLVGAARLLIDFHRSGRFEAYLLAFIATMFGLAGVLFTSSALWDPTWWLWHLLRVTAYGGAQVFAFREYYGTVADLRVLSAEHQAAAAMLRNGEIRYRTLFEQSPDGILLIDPRTTLPVEFNDTASRQLGYSRDEFARLRVSDYEAAETAEETTRHIDALLDTGHASFETRHRTKQGDIRIVLVTVQRIELSGQSVLHCIFRDVTQLHDQAALARLGEMAAVIAHEVKNPLAGVRGAIQVIGGRLLPGGQDAAVIDEIITRIDALDDLMKDLLLFARPPQVRQALVDVVALAKEASILLSKDPTARHVCVEVEGSAPAVMADAKLLNIVLLNLLLNAAHAMQWQGTIRVSVTTDDLTCRIAVADTGPGIPPGIRERIFTPFFTTKPRGTGLGLSTAKRFIEAHHGRMSVACPPAGGTIVAIDLPR
ncbi:MAG: ATP-binding protein [Vicinamibacterales bacterium]|nr:ATP-binding protein [Vicinamibacterales bacterium]